MELSTAQLQTLKTWLLANAGSLNDQQAADALNALATPTFNIYRTAVTQDEVQQNNFDWTRVDNLSVGKARIWEWMFNNESRTVNPSKQVIRNGINETWKGTAADLNVRAAVYVHCYRPATVAEQLFSTGAGTTPDQDGNGPGTTTVDGLVTAQNVIDAYNA